MPSPRLPTYYDVLGVERDAPPAQVRQAWRRLAQQYHPDRRPGNANAVRAMAAINAAYEVLSNAASRAEHDRWIRQAEQHRQPPPPLLPAQGGPWTLRAAWPWMLLFATIAFALASVGATLYVSVVPVRAAAVRPAPQPAPAPAAVAARPAAADKAMPR